MTSIIKVDNIQNSSGTSALSIDSSGNLTATQGFVTGKFTPTVEGVTTAGTFTYDSSNTTGHYQRIGDWVQFIAKVSGTAGSGSAGGLTVANLPFAGGISSTQQAISVGYLDFNGTGWSGYGVYAGISYNETRARLYYMGNQTSLEVVSSNCHGGFSIHIAGTYKVS